MVYTYAMSFLTLLILLVMIGAIILVIRAIVRVYKRPAHSPQPITKFPTFSISMLSISLILLIAGTLMSLFVNDGYGSAIASLGGFFGLLESNVRHKREAHLKEMSVDEAPSE